MVDALQAGARIVIGYKEPGYVDECDALRAGARIVIHIYNAYLFAKNGRTPGGGKNCNCRCLDIPEYMLNHINVEY